MTLEKDYRMRIDKYFEQHFKVEREIYSESGKRIDYVLKCNHSKALFGVEVKSEGHKRGTDLYSFLKQSNEYTQELWKTNFYEVPTKLPIFIAPAVSRDIKQIVLDSMKLIDGIEYFKLFHSRDVKHCNVHGLISHLLSIGEIKKIGDRYIFMYHNWDIWTSYHNPEYRLKEKHYSSYFNFIDLNKVL